MFTSAYTLFTGIMYYKIDAEQEPFPVQLPQACLCLLYVQKGCVSLHRQNQILYVENGELALWKCEDISREIQLSENLPQALLFTIDFTQLDFTQLIAGAEAVFSKLKQYDIDSRIVKKSHPMLRHLFVTSGRIDSEYHLYYYQLKVLEFCMFCAQGIGSEEPICQTAHRQLIEKLNQYVVEHLDQRVTLEELSNRFHVSEGFIRTLYRKTYGMSYRMYQRSLKMESATCLLKDSELSILEIANQLGYENASKFAHAFRSIHGMNPLEYRKRFQS